MNVEIETEALIFLLGEYLFQNFGILSLQCTRLKWTLYEDIIAIIQQRVRMWFARPRIEPCDPICCAKREFYQPSIELTKRLVETDAVNDVLYKLSLKLLVDFDTYSHFGKTFSVVFEIPWSLENDITMFLCTSACLQPKSSLFYPSIKHFA
jgi:hypothetical protein